MAPKTSKAARIRVLLAEGKSTTQIVVIVGCLPEYARVIKQRLEAEKRIGCQRSSAEEAYLIRKFGSLKASFVVKNKRSKAYRAEYNRMRNHRPLEERRRAARKAAQMAREARA